MGNNLLFSYPITQSYDKMSGLTNTFDQIAIWKNAETKGYPYLFWNDTGKKHFCVWFVRKISII